MNPVKHRIKAYLYNNRLTADPNDLVARVCAERSLRIADVCQSAATRGGADTPPAVMEHIVNQFLDEMAYLLCDGFSINANYFTASTVIRGPFVGRDDRFDPDRHSVQFRFTQAEQMRRRVDQIEVEIVGMAHVGVAIDRVEDVKSGTVNDRLTPGSNLRIIGHRLRIAGNKSGVGVAFRNLATEATVAVAPDDLVVNRPSELLVVIPPLPAGTYQLEVTTQYSHSNQLLKEPRTGVFDRSLTVT